MPEWQKSHNSESVRGATLYKKLEVDGTLGSFSFSCSGNNLSQTPDHFSMQTLRAKNILLGAPRYMEYVSERGSRQILPLP